MGRSKPTAGTGLSRPLEVAAGLLGSMSARSTAPGRLRPLEGMGFLAAGAAAEELRFFIKTCLGPWFRRSPRSGEPVAMADRMEEPARFIFKDRRVRTENWSSTITRSLQPPSAH